MPHANRGRLLKNTVFLYFRLILTLGVSLYTSRVVLNALGIEDYGIHNVVAGAVAMVAFLNGAMATATQRFISIEVGRGTGRDQLIRVFSTAFLIHAAIAVIILVVGLTLGSWMLNDVLTIPDNRIEASKWVLVCAIGSLMAQVLLVPFTALILSHERMGVYAYMSILDATIKLIIAYMLGLGDFDRLKLYGVLLVLGSCLVTTFYAFYCSRKFAECRLTRHTDWAKAREMTSFVGWNLSAIIAGMLSNQGLNILLNIHFGPVVNAARGVAMQASGALQGFVSNLQVASAPQIVKTYSAGDYEAERGVIVFASRMSLFLFLVLALPLFLESTQVLSLWLGKETPYADSFLRLILFHSMTMVVSNPLHQAIMATGRIKIFTIVSTVITMIGVFLSWLILSKGGQPSAVFYIAIGVSISLVFLRLLLLRKMISFSIRAFGWQVVTPAFVIFAIGGILPIIFHLNSAQGISRLLAVFVSSFLCLPLAVYAIGLSSDERTQIRRKVIEKFNAQFSS